LALEEAGQQQVALLVEGQLLVEVDVVTAGQQPPALELDERRRDQEELGGDVEVHVTHAVELGQVGVDDRAERHLVQVDLFLQDQVEQEVERPLEHRGRDGVRHGSNVLPGPGVPAHTPAWCACCRASSPPARSTSATTSAPAVSGAPAYSTTT